MDTPSFPGISRTETPVARPPSPPYIHIPAVAENDTAVTLNPITAIFTHAPIFDLGLDNYITRADVQTITQNRAQISPRTQEWTYESRRQAQPILTFLYLGPAAVARDHAFLRRAGITMLLAARDTRQAAARLLGVSKSAAELGLAADYVDVSGRAELISAIPVAVGKINAHLLERGGDGKVLVCCETGNERSAALVAAYIMTMYDAGLVRALQFIHYRRFCTNFDDDIKFLLRSYGDLVAARRTVDGELQVQRRRHRENHDQQQSVTLGGAGKKGKRGISDTSMDEDEGLGDGPGSDLQRFSGRHLTPFVDSGRGDEAMGLGG